VRSKPSTRFVWKSAETTMLEKGKKAPDFEVKDHRGNLVRLRDYLGKVVVLWFYPKADTPG